MHTPYKFIMAPELISIIFRLHEEVSNWGMMGCMFTIDFGSIIKLALESFT